MASDSTSSDEKRDFYRLGSRAKRFEIVRLNEWVNIKYTIGNFTPIPNSNGNKGEEVYQSLKNILARRKRLKTEMVIDGYRSFVLLDKDDKPKVALHIEN